MLPRVRRRARHPRASQAVLRAEQTNAALKIKKAYTQADISTDIANYLETYDFDSSDDPTAGRQW